MDEFDFLLPVWGGEIGPVLEIVRKLSVAEATAVVGFVMQTVPALEQARITTASGQALKDITPSSQRGPTFFRRQSTRIDADR